MLFLSESCIHKFNHCTVAIFRLTDLTEAMNEKVKIGCSGFAFTYALGSSNSLESMSLGQYEGKTIK